MHMKKVLRSVFAIALIALLSVSMVACKKDKEPIATKLFDKQIVNNRFYFQQGYPDNWIYEEGEDGLEIRTLEVQDGHDGLLCTKIYPSENADQRYTIYRYDTHSVMTTLDGFASSLMSDGLRYFNDIFFEDANEGARQSFLITSESAISDSFNHLPFKYVEYSFVRDGDDWKGAFYITPVPNTIFMVLVCEAKASVWESSRENFNKMLNDFAILGFESSSKK